MYRPISPTAHPTLADVPIYVERQNFTQLPQLSFLIAKYDSLTASSLYYDPLNKAVSANAGVSYLRSRFYTTLADPPVKFRHNGSSVDMEIYMHMYTFIPKGPEIGTFSTAPRPLVLKDGDRYERFTSAYVYSGVGVPQRSGKVWDGRHFLCVNRSGEVVSSSSRLENVRGEARGKLENPELIPYTVLSLGGFGHTRVEPDLGQNKSRYDVALRAFLTENYNADSIPPMPFERRTLGRVVTYERFTDTDTVVGTDNYTVTQSRIAALLDGDYFDSWIMYDTYTELTRDVPSTER